MKLQNRFQLDGLIDGFVQMTVMDDGFKHQVKVTPRKMLGIVAQLAKVEDKTNTLTMPVEGTVMQFKISLTEAQQLTSEIDILMKWKR